jgi:hypothetical protein
MYDEERYYELLSELQSDVAEQNARLTTSNSLNQMWIGINLQIVEGYRQIAQKTKFLEKYCKGEC